MTEPTPASHHIEQALHLAGCHYLAAPFILFRLKRTGYSACQVISEQGGLTVRARR